MKTQAVRAEIAEDLPQEAPGDRGPASSAQPSRQPAKPKRLVVIEPGATPCDERLIVRFTRHQRAQHFIMMSSVLLLVFTGMPQKFFDSSISQGLNFGWAMAIKSIARSRIFFPCR